MLISQSNMNDFTSTKPTSAFYFSVVVHLKSEDLGIELLQDIYPGISTFSCTSRNFQSYIECAASCKKLMDNFLVAINASNDSFMLGSELNPEHTGKETVSSGWAQQELARIWIYRKDSLEKQSILAAAQARVFMQLAETTVSIN